MFGIIIFFMSHRSQGLSGSLANIIDQTPLTHTQPQHTELGTLDPNQLFILLIS